MIVLFELLGDEPIENVVTCMNFQIDKVIFWGFDKTINKHKKSTESFLKNDCGVSQITFEMLSQRNLKSIIERMEKNISDELGQNNKIFFDITGGESILLVAFGMLSQKYNVPIHMYDIPKGKIVELDEGAEDVISTDVPRQMIKLTIDRYIKIMGGIVNNCLRKQVKSDQSEEFLNDIDTIWDVAKTNILYWTSFSNVLSKYMVPKDKLCVTKKVSSIRKNLADFNSTIKSFDKLKEILLTLGRKGILLNLKCTDNSISFQYKNQKIKECLFEGGSVFEMKVFKKQKEISNDCSVGVHLDWDGVIHYENDDDVVNEIDVLSITEYVPEFISCKSGKINNNQCLHALYELETVANKFGGKYAKKTLYVAQRISDNYRIRASEMGIEVKVL